jgi:hypothetical protein
VEQGWKAAINLQKRESPARWPGSFDFWRVE